MVKCLIGTSEWLNMSIYLMIVNFVKFSEIRVAPDRDLIDNVVELCVIKMPMYYDHSVMHARIVMTILSCVLEWS